MKIEIDGRVSENDALQLPEGTEVTFNRWAASCYKTTYWRVATYSVTKKKRGVGKYLRLIDAGYGTYPHIGGKYRPEWEGRVLSR